VGLALTGAGLGQALQQPPSVGRGAEQVGGLLQGVGAGLGLAFAAMANAIVSTVPPSQTAVATGLNTIFRYVGGSIGTAVTAAILSSTTAAGGIPADTSFTWGFWVIAGVLVMALIAALLVPGRLPRAQPNRAARM